MKDFIFDGFADELEKIAGRKRSLFSYLFDNPLVEALGYGALMTKGMHLLASGGAFGKMLQHKATSPQAARLGTMGMGVGATYLGIKGLGKLLRHEKMRREK